MNAELGGEAAAHNYTVVVTSCGRFDLLRRTLRSLKEHMDQPPVAWVIIEDSGEEEARLVASELDLPGEVIINRPNLGQMKSIDKAYAAVKTPYVFHCEDDWEFFRSGFIAESFRVLDARRDVSVVCLRPRKEEHPLVRDLPAEAIAGVSVYLLDPKLHPEYFSYAFNPGMRRMEDYLRFGPFAPLGHEPDVSYAFKKAGFRIANLDDPAVRHIGYGRHIDDPTMPKRARTAWEKLRRSINKRVKRIRRAFGG